MNMHCMQKMKWMVWMSFCLSATGSLRAQGGAMPGSNTDSLKKEAAKQKAANAALAAKTQFFYFVIKAESGTYGYDVYADGASIFIKIPSRGLAVQKVLLTLHPLAERQDW